MPLTFVKPRLMRWNANAVSDHNRAALSISTERIEKKQRMWNGTMRKYVIGDKRTYSTSWENLPKPTGKTVDGFWGGAAIEAFYYNTQGAFTLELTDADGNVTTATVMFSDYSREIIKRGTSGIDLWNISITMEEV